MAKAGRRTFSLLFKYIKLNKEAPKMAYTLRIPQTSIAESESSIDIKHLSNGATLILEKPAFPSNTHLSLLFPTGRRDLPADSSTLQSLKNTFLGSSESNHYTRLQLLGSQLQFDFDNEFILYQGQCLAEAFTQYLDLLKIIINAPKASDDQEAISARHREFWRHNEETSLERANKEIWMNRVLRGGLELSLAGAKEHVPSVDEINEFVKKRIVADGAVVYVSGAEGVEACVEKIEGLLEHKGQKPVREKSEFVAGESRVACENELSYVNLCFEAAKVTERKFHVFEILKHVYGDSSEVKVGSKALARARSSNIIKSIKAENVGFSDIGVFGLVLSMAAGYINNASEILAKEVEAIAKIGEAEFLEGKSKYILDLLVTLDTRALRAENACRQLSITGKILPIEEVVQEIQSITYQEFRQTANSLKELQPNLTYLSKSSSSSVSLSKILTQS